MLIQTAECRRIHIVRLNSGDDVLLAVREAVRELDLRNGVILTGLGSLSRYHIHVVESTNLPPGNAFRGEEGPYDILNINGLILEGRVHAHITFSGLNVALGGHMEEGCRILTFGIVILGEATGAGLLNWDRVGTISE